MSASYNNGFIEKICLLQFTETREGKYLKFTDPCLISMELLLPETSHCSTLGERLLVDDFSQNSELRLLLSAL